ncbi:MAG: hypothetical protein L0J41_04575, partial [Alkalibacterium sp.]|uniref:hypothetical protein n=1 Tax=Alkalibacterium sp. TaxID=1872447 RepID=UPI0026487C5C
RYLRPFQLLNIRAKCRTSLSSTSTTNLPPVKMSNASPFSIRTRPIDLSKVYNTRLLAKRSPKKHLSSISK